MNGSPRSHAEGVESRLWRARIEQRASKQLRIICSWPPEPIFTRSLAAGSSPDSGLVSRKEERYAAWRNMRLISRRYGYGR